MGFGVGKGKTEKRCSPMYLRGKVKSERNTMFDQLPEQSTGRRY